jgi:hypothetical protein
MREQRSDDNSPVPGSLLETSGDRYLEPYRFNRLWNRSSGPTVLCQGCGAAVQRSRAGGRGRWCRRCAVISEDMGRIRSAAKKCAEYGLTDAASALKKALADMRALMRNDSPGV